MYRTIFLIFCSAEVFLKAKGTDPELDTKEETVTVVEGSTAILPCSIVNLGDHKVVWMNYRQLLLSSNERRILDDQRLSIERPYHRDWNLHIRNVLQSDSGEYMCKINTNPVKSKTVHLEVKVPSKLQTSSEDQTIHEGESLQLFCNITGVPKPDIVWSKVHDNTFDDTGNGFEHTGEILMIENVSRTDQGIYRCRGYNGVEPALSHSIKVIVEFPPVVFTHVERIKQYYGKDTILSCDITARPFATMSWFKNDRRPIPFFPSKYRTDIYHNNANTITMDMRINDLSADDFGRYTCYAGNHLGEDEAYVELEAIGTDPELDEKEVNVTVVEGSTVILPCLIEGFGDYQVSWTDNNKTLLTLEDRRIIDDYRISIEQLSVFDWNLQIRSVLYSDQGQYTCQMNSSPVQFVNLEVKVPTKLETSSEDQTIHEGESLQLFCKMTGVPKPDIVWSNVSGNASEDNGNGFEHTGEVLVIENVSRTDQGTYRCRGYNGVGTAVSQSIKVIVHYPPVVSTPAERIMQYPGKEVILSCDINANPIAVSYWLKNDKRRIFSQSSDILVDDTNTMTMSLRIKDLSAEDFGRYTCYAYNRLGKSEAHVELKAKDKDPELDAKKVNVTVVEGSTAILPCSIVNLGDHKVVWTDHYSTLLTYKDRRIIDDSRISIERPYTPNWDLQIRDVLYSDRGRYTCQINTSPVISKIVNLEVTAKDKDPELDAKKVNVTVVEGSTAILPCSIVNLGDHKVVWTDNYSTLLTYNDNRMIDDSRISIERPYTPNWDLQIRDVLYSDRGRYTCQINTFPVISKIVNLEVTGSGTTSEMVTEIAPVATETQPDLNVPDINENATRGSNDKPSRKEVSNNMLKAIRLEYYREQIQTDRKWRSILNLQETYYRTVVKYLQKHDSATNETNMLMVLTP